MKEEKEVTKKPLDSSEEVTDIEEDNGQGQEKPSIPIPSEIPPVQHSVPDTSSETVQEVTQEQLQAYILTKLVEGSSYRDLEKEVGIPKSTLQKYYPKSYIDNVRLSLQRQQEEKLGSQQTQAPIQRPQQQPDYQEPLDQTALPPGSIVFTPELITSIRSGLSPQQQRIFDMALNVATQRQGQMIRHSQASPLGSLDAAEARLVEEMAKSVRFKRYQDMQRGYDPGNNPGSRNPVTDALNAIKIGVDLVGKPQNVDRLGIYRIGREDAKGELQRLGKSGETNSLDLRLEELRQSHDVDMQKISFEQKKFFLQLESERDKWDKIQETFAPVLQMAAPEIRDSIRKLGESIGRGLGGAAQPKVQNPNIVKTECPKCHNPLNIPVPENAKDLVNVVCPSCKNVFQLEEEKQPEPELRPKAEGKLGSKLGSRYT